MMGQVIGAFIPSLCWADLQLSLPFGFLLLTYVFFSSSVVCLTKRELKFKAVWDFSQAIGISASK